MVGSTLPTLGELTADIWHRRQTAVRRCLKGVRGREEWLSSVRRSDSRAMTRALLLLLRGRPEPDICPCRADITSKNTRIVLQNIGTACLRKLRSKQRETPTGVPGERRLQQEAFRLKGYRDHCLAFSRAAQRGCPASRSQRGTSRERASHLFPYRGRRQR